jgi:hypothetical protein
MKRISYSRFIVCLSGLLISSSCREFVAIDPPRTDLIRATVFASDATATSAMLDIYNQMHAGGFASGDLYSITFFGALSADEGINELSFIPEEQAINDNAILVDNFAILGVWSDLYKCIYKANAILEGVTASTGMTTAVKKQLQGEAKFARAFCYFYLVNLFGDVPLVTITTYQTNQNIGRSPAASVYQQVVADLTDAQNLLPDGFAISNDERIRVNKGAATALLARTYLFTGDWVNAEKESSLLIADSALYNLDPLNEVFLKNSTEAIFQLPPVGGPTFDYISAENNYQLQPVMINAFEPSDQRSVNWVSGNIATKYKTGDDSYSEYSMVLRLAEQYLIRAEAYARQNDIANGLSDLNVIRNRAGLPPSTAASKTTLLAAIAQERRVELFTEWGHRWLDLKRYGAADSVLAPLKPAWVPTAALYPIPIAQIINDPAMTQQQNPGY